MSTPSSIEKLCNTLSISEGEREVMQKLDIIDHYFKWNIPDENLKNACRTKIGNMQVHDSDIVVEKVWEIQDDYLSDNDDQVPMYAHLAFFLNTMENQNFV